MYYEFKFNNLWIISEKDSQEKGTYRNKWAKNLAKKLCCTFKIYFHLILLLVNDYIFNDLSNLQKFETNLRPLWIISITFQCKRKSKVLLRKCVAQRLVTLLENQLWRDEVTNPTIYWGALCSSYVNLISIFSPERQNVLQAPYNLETLNLFTILLFVK